MPLDFSYVSVKKEPEWSGVSEAALKADLYADHEVKEEIVLGPEVFQPPDSAFVLRSQVTGLHLKMETEQPVTEISTLSNPETSLNLEKLHNIKPCFIRLVRIDISKSRIKNKTNSTKKTLKPKKFFCDFCSKGFSMKQRLLIHIRIHTGEKPHDCNICRKKFSDMSILIRHRRIHTGEKPHVCDVCNKQFSEKYLLRYHKRLHTGDAPYACKFCDKTYNHISNFKRHLRNHEAKPFLCEICNVHFSEQSKLETHLLSHLKEKPFVCEICKKRFPNKGKLNWHLKSHYEKKYYCKVCDVRFTQFSSFKRHEYRKLCGISNT